MREQKMSTLTVQELAEKVAYRIRNHPETWNQRWWGTLEHSRLKGRYLVGALARPFDRWEACGTTACVAGHTVSVAFTADPELVDTVSTSIGVGRLAARLLGLDGDENTWLFAAVRTEQQVLEVLDALAAGYSWEHDLLPKICEPADDGREHGVLEIAGEPEPANHA